MFDAVALVAEQLENSRSDVSAFGIEHRIKAALKTFVALLAVVRRDFAQSEQDHRAVVHVRIPFVVEFKYPSAGLNFGGIFILPIATETDFFRHQPLS